MTINEYFSLSNRVLYKFRLYYADSIIGFMVENDSNYYIITPKHKKDYNDGKKPLSEIGKRVLLDQVESYEIYNENQKSNFDTNILEFNGTLKTKKLIILGAGASFDYSFDPNSKTKEFNPPLANDLFSDNFMKVISKYSGAMNLSPEIILASRHDIESYFQEQWQKILETHNPILFSNLINIQFYLHHLFEEITSMNLNKRENNYWALAKKAHEYTTSTGEHIAVVSFNYDTLFEEALTKQVKYEFDNMNNYIDFASRKILLFKPHGSYNWIRKIKGKINNSNPYPEYSKIKSLNDFAERIHNSSISFNKINSMLSDEITVRHRSHIDFSASHPQYNSQYLSYLYVPQLLIPFKDKDGFFMPKSHELVMGNFLTDINEILIIGWKGSEQKFLELLSKKFNNSSLKITIVNKNDGQSVMDNFKHVSSEIEFINTECTFSNYIEIINSKNEHFFV